MAKTDAVAGYILALDLGTTGNRAFLFNPAGDVLAQAYQELTQFYPQPGWLEHDPEEIWQATRSVMHAAIAQAKIHPQDIRAIGLTVQRETCLLWDKTTGQPLHRAIVWQDRRTAPLCDHLRQQGHAPEIYDRTGLVLDAYFSATKLRWLLDSLSLKNPDSVLAGTIDSWILWKLTGGRVHATDHSNASRTLLMNLTTGTWDDRLLELFAIPPQILPQIQPSLGEFGVTDRQEWGAEIPIMAILGDQQASLLGHGCDRAGLMKCTYGTGSFLVAHTGSEVLRSDQQLVSTIAWTQPNQMGQVQMGYAIEGSIFTAGACIQWLRDGLKLIGSAAETDAIAQQVTDTKGVCFIPALSGLGAPHWDMAARGAFMGLTAGVEREHLVRSVLEAIAYQVKEVVAVIQTSHSVQSLRVDGGACENQFLMQWQADILQIPVVRPVMRDTTVQGVAFAAAVAAGICVWEQPWARQQAIDRVFEPSANVDRALAGFAVWQQMVGRVKGTG